MWNSVYTQAASAISKLSDQGSNRLFFRGHSDGSWPLLPTLGRCKLRHRDLAERRLYFDFTVRSGTLLPPDSTGWDALFAMQHHGIPTRLLDWTETFAVALYFALKGSRTDAAIWVLRPGLLNQRTSDTDGILEASDLAGRYSDVFLSGGSPMTADVVALSPHRHNPRVAQQRGGFTLHTNLDAPLEILHPDVVTKISIPRGCNSEAERFLELSGVSEFSLFPDLDGLARELTHQHVVNAARHAGI